MIKIIFMFIMICTGLTGCWMVYKREQRIKRLERETGKSYGQLIDEFYRRK